MIYNIFQHGILKVNYFAGLPKGAMITHHNLVVAMFGIAVNVVSYSLLFLCRIVYQYT